MKGVICSTYIALICAKVNLEGFSGALSLAIISFFKAVLSFIILAKRVSRFFRSYLLSISFFYPSLASESDIYNIINLYVS